MFLPPNASEEPVICPALRFANGLEHGEPSLTTWAVFIMRIRAIETIRPLMRSHIR